MILYFKNSWTFISMNIRLGQTHLWNVIYCTKPTKRCPSSSSSPVVNYTAAWKDKVTRATRYRTISIATWPHHISAKFNHKAVECTDVFPLKMACKTVSKTLFMLYIPYVTESLYFSHLFSCCKYTHKGATDYYAVQMFIFICITRLKENLGYHYSIYIWQTWVNRIICSKWILYFLHIPYLYNRFFF